jgi:two-component system sensor histidine kinase UhpB
VVIQQDERRAFSVLRTSQAGLLVTTGLLVVMGVLLSRGLSRSVIDPVQELSRKTAELEVLSSQRRVLVRRLLAAGEEERRRIARELHDEISQLLTVVQLSLEHAGEGPAAGELDLDKVRSLLARTQKEVHRVIHDLRPSLLDDLGLAPAVRWYAASYLEPEGIDASLEVDDALELPEEVEITTFRIYQEIVTNILRHSKADHVSVELYREDGRLILAVEDDGVGFAASDPAEGAGLVGIRERAALVGGRVDIDSEPGMGTHVRLEIPL